MMQVSVLILFLNNSRHSRATPLSELTSLSSDGSAWLWVATATMSFHIRDARKDDVPALASLHVQTFNETHCGGRADGPSLELREHQWREAFAGHDGSWFC